MASKKVTVTCGEALTIANVADLHGKLTKALDKSSTIELEAHEVEKVDTAGLQLLVALNHELEKSSGRIIWKNPSDALSDAIQITGMAPYLTFNQQV